MAMKAAQRMTFWISKAIIVLPFIGFSFGFTLGVMVLPDRDVIHYWMLLPATAIILLLSFLEKRKCRTNICGGRPALIIPIPSLDSYENRLAYAVAFGVTLNSTILTIFIGPSTDRSVWFSAFYSLLQALIICVVFFPYFACISTRFRAAGAIINIIYCSVWLGFDVAACETDLNDEERNDYAEFFNKPRYKAIIVLTYLPNFVCQMVFIVYCIYILYRCAKSKSFVSQRIPGAVRPHQVEHVRWVFRKSKDKIYQASLSANQTSFVACM